MKTHGPYRAKKNKKNSENRKSYSLTSLMLETVVLILTFCIALCSLYSLVVFFQKNTLPSFRRRVRGGLVFVLKNSFCVVCSL